VEAPAEAALRGNGGLGSNPESGNFFLDGEVAVKRVRKAGKNNFLPLEIRLSFF
jgi:hypothetical protein